MGDIPANENFREKCEGFLLYFANFFGKGSENDAEIRNMKYVTLSPIHFFPRATPGPPASS